MEPDAEIISIHYKHDTLTRTLWFSALIGIAMVWFTWVSWQSPLKTVSQATGMFLGPACTIICFLMFLGALRSRQSGQAPLEVSQKGIAYTHLLMKTKRVRWRHIGFFALREQVVYRNKTQNIVEVLPRDGNKPLLSIHPDDLDIRLSDLTSLLESFATAHADRPGEYITDDKRVSSGSKSRLYGVVGTAAFFVLSFIGRVGCTEINRVAAVNQEMAEFDNALSKNAMFQAIQKVSPAEYSKCRDMVRSGLEDGLSGKAIRSKLDEFTHRFLDKRLAHAPSALVKKYAVCQTSVYQEMADVSPEILYNFLSTGQIDKDALPESVQAHLKQKENAMVDAAAAVVVAPPDNTSTSQDDTIIAQRAVQICAQLPYEEVDAMRNSGKEEVDHATYSMAMLHFYQKALELPDKDAVQLLRSMGMLPKDGRAGS